MARRCLSAHTVWLPRAALTALFAGLWLLNGCTPLGDNGAADQSLSRAGASIEYDIVLSGGHVMDPETGLSAIRNVGISNGKISAISKQDLLGKQLIAVDGMVVAPGFIDLHNHSPTPLGQQFQALDGVTTSLELEAGSYPVSDHGKYLEQGAAINFGASASHAAMRIQLKPDTAADSSSSNANAGPRLSGRAYTEPANAEEREQLRALLNEGLDQGGLGIGLLLDYMSTAVDDAELRLIFEVAGERQTPVFVHIRRGMPGDISGLEEVIALASESQAPVHICHLQHSAMRGTSEFLKLIRQARAGGLDISTEFFPYNAGSTSISAAVFFRDWQSIFDITYEDVEWAATGERFTELTWKEYQQKYPKGAVIHHYVDEAWTRELVEADEVIVVTDGLPIIDTAVLAPPQGVGSFAKILGHYVREKKALSLMSALRKMTLLPAQRLEKTAPVFARKGRLQVGADADITVFDPDSIASNSTFRKPYQASSGVEYLLVNGKPVISAGEFLQDSKPGLRLTSKDK